MRSSRERCAGFPERNRLSRLKRGRAPPRLTPVICPRLDAPIVLAHGLFGFTRIGLGRWTLAVYFRDIPELLRAAGNRVLVSRVHPTAGVARRAWKLKQRIETAFPDESVHIIGHSMGGLDARMLLADPSWRRRVLSLTTIGTPHLGSSLADVSRLRMVKIYRMLERVGLDHNGFFDVTRKISRERHERLPLPDDIPCFSIAGTPSQWDVSRPLKRFHEALLEWEGPNDGLVSVESAEAFGTPLPSWPLDHFHQLNWFNPPVPVLPLYADLLVRLAALGFGDEAAAEVVEEAPTFD